MDLALPTITAYLCLHPSSSSRPIHSPCVLYRVDIARSSAGCGPDQEALLTDVEVDVAADLMGHIGAKVATHDAVPH